MKNQNKLESFSRFIKFVLYYVSIRTAEGLPKKYIFQMFTFPILFDSFEKNLFKLPKPVISPMKGQPPILPVIKTKTSDLSNK